MQHSIAADHPSLPGHFPGHPLVPGVVMLNYVMDAVLDKVFQTTGAAASVGATRPSIRGIRRIKFLQPLSPSQIFRVEVAEPESQKVGFRCWAGDVLLAEGQLVLSR
jgi:3-hydroxymyristoyl/3-hydroxydecanoyl-(acyl carrier protein) dehydratase